MRFVWQLLAMVAVSFAAGQALRAVDGHSVATLVVGTGAAALAVYAYAAVVRWSERRKPVSEVALQSAVAGLGWGTLIGVGLFALVIVNIAFMGGYTVEGVGTPTGALGLFGFMAVAAVNEELLFRGVLFRILEGWTGTWIAWALTAALFGIVIVL
jgi:uncharacterized protein